MAHIYIYSPSTAVQDPVAFKRGIKRLEAKGHAVELDEAVLKRHTRFAGDDATRIAAVARAAASGADMAMISRGGYGLTRILGDLPYKAITKSIERGTQWIGLSDFTALQLALMAKSGPASEVSTWAGPCVCEDFIVEDASKIDEITMACFDDLIAGQAEGTGWRLPRADNAPYLNTASKKIASNPIDPVTKVDIHIKNATLWGGNLCVLTSMVGSSFMPVPKRGILFLEDTGEHPYKIERMLTTLLNAGILSQQKAILMGQFSRIVPLNNDRGYKLQTVVEWLRTKVKCPVLTGLPMGHVPTKVCLPVGRTVELAVEGSEALIVWGE